MELFPEKEGNHMLPEATDRETIASRRKIVFIAEG
jgi:hypothetical protein